MDFGKGPTLIEACAWLRDDAERVQRILDVVERNSVIAGLPPFDEAFRERLRRDLLASTSAVQTPPGR